MVSGWSAPRKNQLDLSIGIALGGATQLALFVGTAACALQLFHRAGTDDIAILAGRRRNGRGREHYLMDGDEQRYFGVVRRRVFWSGFTVFRHESVSAADRVNLRIRSSPNWRKPN
jgi:hypothetical protein